MTTSAEALKRLSTLPVPAVTRLIDQLGWTHDDLVTIRER